MKFLIAAAFMAIAYTQDALPKPHNGAMAPPIAIYEKEVLDPKVQQNKKQVISEQPNKIVRQPIMLGKDEFNPSAATPEMQLREDHFHDGPMPGQQEFNPSNRPLLGGEEFNPTQFVPGQNQFRHPTNKPLLGAEEFNPTNFVPPGPMPGQSQFNPFEFVPSGPGPWQHDRMRKNNKHNGKGKHGELRKHGEGRMNQDFRTGNHPMGWQDHNMRKRFHKKMCAMFIFTAIIFTLFGLCIGKCFRKCKKNKRRQVRQIVMRQKTSIQVSEEIKEQQKKLQELKAEYRNKRAQEDQALEQRRFQEGRVMNEMRQINQGRQFYPNTQPYVVHNQPAFYNPRGTIPVGRPLNESANSSFATEYPTL